MYCVIWKYKIKPEKRETFELEYGVAGTWLKLFSKSENYGGSLLLKSDEEEDTYILIDTWTTKKSYRSFKKLHEETYTKLSSQFQYLYETEEKIGAFNSIV